MKVSRGKLFCLINPGHHDDDGDVSLPGEKVF